MLVAMIRLSGTDFRCRNGRHCASTRRRHRWAAASIRAKLGRFMRAEGAVEWGSDQLHSLLNNALDPTQDQLNTIGRTKYSGIVRSPTTISRRSGASRRNWISSGDYSRVLKRLCAALFHSGQRGRRAPQQPCVARDPAPNLFRCSVWCVLVRRIWKIFPGADMTFAGPIHTNADLYMGADGATLTCAVYRHGRRALLALSQGQRSAPTSPDLFTVKDQFGVSQNVWRGNVLAG